MNTPNPNIKPQKSTHFFVFVILIGLIVIVFSAGKYIEFQSPGPFDSGSFVYSAKNVLDGARIGFEEKLSARLGTLLTNMLGVYLFGFEETGPKIVQMILQAVALVLMFLSMIKLFGRLPAALATLLAAFYMSAPVIAKTGNQKEQYMVAFMVIGVSAFILRQLNGRWWWAVLSGSFLAWAPMFKQTGVSAIAAVGIYLIIQPVFKTRTWRETAHDTVLLLAGAAVSIAPICFWLARMKTPFAYWPYVSFFRVLFPMQGQRFSSYILKSREMMAFSEWAPRILRYYKLLALPIALAVGSIFTVLGRRIRKLIHATPSNFLPASYRFALLLTVWWILDMAFVWISPRSYEHYYLSLTASAAMLGGFFLKYYFDKLRNIQGPVWRILLGAVTFGLMLVLIWPSLFGLAKSPFSNTKYPTRRNGYVQKMKEVWQRKKQGNKYAWEVVAEYIGENSRPKDKIYVWGWYPGIYVKAKRMSTAYYSSVGEMHVKHPKELSKIVSRILDDLKKEPPVFIVDSRKNHFPWNRPPLELWPIIPSGFMGRKKSGFLPPKNKKTIETFNRKWNLLLEQRYGIEEAQRFIVMEDFRRYVRENYSIVGMFGPHVLFRLKPTQSSKETRFP